MLLDRVRSGRLDRGRPAIAVLGKRGFLLSPVAFTRVDRFGGWLLRRWRRYRAESGPAFSFEAKKVGLGSFWDTFRAGLQPSVGIAGFPGGYSAVKTVGVAGDFVV